MGKRIGAGHFGEVFHGTDDVHGSVAVKVLTQKPLESSTDWAARKAGLLKEAQHLKQASHDNVVKVYHLLESDTTDAILFVMDYCRGGSLQAVYEAGPTPISTVRKIATEVALGLQALHFRGLLHRDIKPANILICDSGLAQLADFGLVTDNIILGYASQAGYKDHIAYEVWAGKGTSVKSDIWAFGMTLYRLLHGAEWYSRGPAPRYVVQSGGFAESLSWLPHVPKQWRTFIRKTLRDDPTKRYQNATQVLTDLARLPVEPNWNCSTSKPEVRWELATDKRKKLVSWKETGSNTFEWTGWSEPIALGRQRKLGGSMKPLTYKQAERALQDFLCG